MVVRSMFTEILMAIFQIEIRKKEYLLTFRRRRLAPSSLQSAKNQPKQIWIPVLVISCDNYASLHSTTSRISNNKSS